MVHFLFSLSSCVYQWSLADGLPLGSPAMDNLPILVFALLGKCLLGVIVGTSTEGQTNQLRTAQQTSAAHTSMKCWGSSSSEAGPLQHPSSSPVFPNVSWSIKAPAPCVIREVWGPCQLARLDYSWSSNLASTPTIPELSSSLYSGQPESRLFQDKTKNSRWSPLPSPIMYSFFPENVT